jgi:hypothetical protein
MLSSDGACGERTRRAVPQTRRDQVVESLKPLYGKLIPEYNQKDERASYNGSIEASQASDVGSIPIARSIKPVDAVGLTGLHSQKRPIL